MKISNEMVIVRPAEYKTFDCDKCHFSRYPKCPHTLCSRE